MVKPSLQSLLSWGLVLAGTGLGEPAAAATLASDWVSEALAAVKTSPSLGPTGAARAYGILGTAMYDAWSAYAPTPMSTRLGDMLQRPGAENTLAHQEEAVSYAAYRVLSELFPQRLDAFNARLVGLGFDPNQTSTDTTTAAGVGNVMAETLLQFRRYDGSNPLGGYADTTGYVPVNRPEAIIDLERWTPEHVPIDEQSAPLQKFLTPHWGEVTPFALANGSQFRSPAPEPFLLVEGTTVDLEAKTLTLEDGSTLAIERSLVGTIINPEFIEQAQELVELSAGLTDEQKLMAEFWEDPGGTAFPPSHWLEFGQWVAQRDNHRLEEDIQLFFALGNAVMDAGIATWETKRFYDYTRPVRAIRELGRLGLIGTDDGTGTWVIEAWGGPGQGTVTLPATGFIPYQTPGGNPSPPFAEYTSGHSAFSAASAEILRRFTGSEAFGLSVTYQPGESRFEPGLMPENSTTLSWETFAEAAAEAGLSRRYGGIHFADGDLAGRRLGRQVGTEVWQRSQFFLAGGRSVPEPSAVIPLLVLGGLFLGLSRQRR